MRARAWTLTCLVTVGASIAGATQFQAFDRTAQVRGSDAIVLGRVLSVASAWDESSSAIHTDAVVAIDEVWKGWPSSDRVIVRSPGGSVDDIEAQVDGAAQFRRGEQVVVFLEEDGAVYRPWGMLYGKYSIDGGTASPFLVGSLPPVISGAQSYEMISIDLEDLRREVRAIVEGES